MNSICIIMLINFELDDIFGLSFIREIRCIYLNLLVIIKCMFNGKVS